MLINLLNSEIPKIINFITAKKGLSSISAFTYAEVIAWSSKIISKASVFSSLKFSVQ